MPTISMFYGIIVYLYFYDDREHHKPHIHVEYQENKAVFAISDGEMISGNMPNNKKRLVQAWIEIHREDLAANWNLAVRGEEVFKIDPLK